MLLKRRSRTKATAGAATLRHAVSRLSPLFLILAAITLMLFNQTQEETVQKMRAALTDMAAPALSFISKPFTSLSQALDGYTNFTTLQSENIQLREENEKLRKWYDAALRLEAENKSLRSLLNLIDDPTRQYLTARVIADPGGNFVRSLLISAGKKDGVRKGLAAITNEGLAGRVTEAGNNSARILMVTDLNSHIPVIVENTRQRAILAGDNTDEAVLRYLPHGSAAEIGSRIVTSGHGGILPAGIPVGEIVSAENDEIRVRPYVDIKRLSFVQIVDSGLNLDIITTDDEDNDKQDNGEQP